MKWVGTRAATNVLQDSPYNAEPPSPRCQQCTADSPQGGPHFTPKQRTLLVINSAGITLSRSITHTHGLRGVPSGGGGWDGGDGKEGGDLTGLVEQKLEGTGKGRGVTREQRAHPWAGLTDQAGTHRCVSSPAQGCMDPKWGNRWENAGEISARETLS